METQPVSLSAAAKLKRENDTLKKQIRLLIAEVERMRRKLEMTWGEA
jgi:hypothetical protein